MKILILLSCTFAISQAGYAAQYYQPQQYQHQPIHIPVIGPNGVPIETPEVQAAKAHHYAEYAKTLSRPGQDIPDTQEYSHGNEGHYSAPAPVQYSHAPLYYKGPGGPPAQIGHDGQPLETHEVQAAKAAHFAAVAEAASRASYGGHGHYRRRRGIFGDYHIPVLDHNGVPVETPEVQAAKAHHFAEYSKVLSRPGQNIPDHSDYSHGGGSGAQYSAVEYSTPVYHSAAPSHYADASSHYAPSAYSHSPSAYSHSPYQGPYAEIGHDGRPVETHEVQAAKAAHFAAYNAAKAGQYAAKAGQYGHHYY